MPYISEGDLMMVIQAVDDQIHTLKTKLDDPASDADADDEEMLLVWTQTAAGLERAYRQALSEIASLPEYERLVRQ